MNEAAKYSDHRRIAWRLSGRIFGAQIAAFIIVDLFLALVILLAGSDPAMFYAVPLIGGWLAAWAEWLQNLRAIRVFGISYYWYWALLNIIIFQFIVTIAQTAKLRRDIRELLEPLRELRVAADAFAGAAGTAGAAKKTEPGGAGMSPEALRRVTEALRQVEARDMNPHLAAENVPPELRPLLDAITEMLDRLEASYAAQTQFVADASHELRTPIAVIQGYANLLSRWGSEDPEVLRESVEAIRTEADSMKRMTNQLLFLARGDSGALPLDLQRVDLVKVAEEVLREERMIEEGAGDEEKQGGEGGPEGSEPQGRHEFEARFPEGGVYVTADPALVKQLIRILVDNSVKYTPPGGGITLSVSAEAKAGRALVKVQDEGQGIPAGLLPQVFDRFVRADEARTRGAGGLGLGLSIAKQIAERHGGALEVFSVEGVGTRFTVSLPLLEG